MARQSGQAQVLSYVDEKRIDAMQFGLLSPETVSQISVAEIKSTQIYDQETFQPNIGAVNDPRLGVMDSASRCVTCRAGMDACPGHFGHITLNAPVYHAGMLVYIQKFLKMVCFNCSKLLAPRGDSPKALEDREFLLKIRSPKLKFKKMLQLAGEVSVCDAENGGCGYKQPKFRKSSLRLDIEYRDENFDKTKDNKDVLWPDVALKVLERISDDDCKLMGLDPRIGRPDWCIIRNLPVAPPPVRPSVAMTSTMRSEDDLTYSYQQILKMNNMLREQKEMGANQTIINELRTTLQYFVATLMDNSIAGQPVHKHKSGKPLKSLRSRLKGKEGRLRGNLMGKRVDFSARTVITPDPNLKLDELGVPVQVAKGLTIPETVTPHNIEQLRVLVANGPSQWPGAKYIIRLDDRQIDLSMVRNRSDVHLELGYKVERHLQDGDYVLFNRQPSLHKMSIMGHRVKVLPFSTFRLNLSVTTPYNADFDGDEMNMHVPQSYETMAEIKEIMSVPRQILSPQSNKPVMGIVQDSLLGGMLMTQRDCFLDKEQAMQMMMWVPDGCVGGEIRKLPPPAICKPKALWSGKQIYSLLIPKVNMARVKSKENWCCSRDQNILVEQGELICGVLTKQVVGSVGQGLGHIITKEYGPQECAVFLTSVQKVINNWLIYSGFTVGVQDIIIKEKQVAKGIRDTLFTYQRNVRKLIRDSHTGQLKSQPGKTMQESFEAQVNKNLNDARDKAGNLAVDGLVNSNRLKNMVNAGSKGSNINISQIMGCVGQQNVEGKRIPFGFLRRTLPHFPKDDYGPESRGFVESSYLTGLKPAELFFHAMGGREGLIDTAVKTAETGYISRRLIKALEDVMCQYDGTVRGSKNDIIQFLYGEDGMAGEAIEDMSIDIIKTNDKELKQQCLFPRKGKSESQDQRLTQALDEQVYSTLDDATQIKSLESEFRSIIADRENLRNEVFKTNQDDQVHLPVNVARLIWNAKSQFGIKPNSKSNLKPEQVVQQLSDLVNDLSVIPGSKGLKNKLLEDADLNARRLFNTHLRYQLCAKNVILQERLSQPAFEWLLSEIKSRFEQSIVSPGEMVGSLAAQSLGEPATQMTLNTFHFAGISAKNVTLGVPRFKEIINVSNNIKTPSLKIFLKPKYSKKESKVSKLGMMIEHTTLAHVVSKSAIYYDPNPERTVVPEDAALVQLYNDVPVLDEGATKQQISPWLLRFELDRDRMVHKGLTMSQIDKKLTESFGDQVSVMVSDENSDKHVVRIRINNIADDEEDTVSSYIKHEFEPLLLNHLALKGFPEITKVTYTKHQEKEFCPKTGKQQLNDENWIIETDGTALAKILAVPKVDATRTVSNDNLEVLNVLGIEAARQSLINELRFVLSSYGIYVNYRHISTLVDVMSLKGKLTSITRHGINRVDTSGPLRKCTFEETVEILLEGAVFSEKDGLRGISENVIVGQLGPFGSGAFGISIDQDCIEKNAHTSYSLNGMLEQQDSDYHVESPDHKGLLTPILQLTPQYEGAEGPTTDTMMTPGSVYGANGGAFSPKMDEGGFGLNVPGQSPLYASPSPVYGSTNPMYGRPFSPAFQGNQAGSPIYNAASGGNLASGIYQSPAYNQPQNCYSPVYTATSPAYQRSGAPVSPAYSPSTNALQSPSYSANHQSTPGQYSPAYSPSATSSRPLTKSPDASATPTKGIQSPVYMPPLKMMSPAYDPKMVVKSSPAYNPSSPGQKAVRDSEESSDWPSGQK